MFPRRGRALLKTPRRSTILAGIVPPTTYVLPLETREHPCQSMNRLVNIVHKLLLLHFSSSHPPVPRNAVQSQAKPRIGTRKGKDLNCKRNYILNIVWLLLLLFLWSRDRILLLLHPPLLFISQRRRTCFMCTEEEKEREGRRGGIEAPHTELKCFVTRTLNVWFFVLDGSWMVSVVAVSRRGCTDRECNILWPQEIFRMQKRNSCTCYDSRQEFLWGSFILPRAWSLCEATNQPASNAGCRRTWDGKSFYNPLLQRVSTPMWGFIP